jgi:hypothetical protein
MYIHLNGYYTDGNNRFYLYSNNILIRHMIGSDFKIERYKNQRGPYDYGWFFIEQNKITIQFYVSAEGSPYVIVEEKGRIINEFQFILEESKQLTSGLFGKSTIRKDKINNVFIYRNDIKPDSMNPWIPIDSISYEKAKGKNTWRKKFNGYK